MAIEDTKKRAQDVITSYLGHEASPAAVAALKSELEGIPGMSHVNVDIGDRVNAALSAWDGDEFVEWRVVMGKGKDEVPDEPEEHPENR